MDFLKSFIELTDKYAWAVFLTAGILLFSPIEIVERLKIDAFRDEYIGELWLVFIFSGLLTIVSLRSFFWRYILCPFKKFLFPITDARNCVKQSRMRYYLMEFLDLEGQVQTVYQEVTSEGSVTRYVSITGKRVLLPQSGSSKIIGDGNFQFPCWGKIDWSDIFSGNLKSGCWGISEPK
jgi:hypothetical protein